MPKFFVSKEQIKDGLIIITGEDAGHISRVLRMGAGDSLVACDGCGFDYDTRIESISKSEIAVRIENIHRCEAEPHTEIVLYQCLPKKGKMEYIIQKNTELGVLKIVPVFSKRCVAKPTDKPTDKLERWQRVAQEAAKQSGRGVIPIVCATISFEEAVKQMSVMRKSIMLYENEQNVTLKQVIGNDGITQIGILIGPEGGFDDFEAELALKNSIPTVSLGKRILRTETAGAAVVPIIMYSQGDI